ACRIRRKAGRDAPGAIDQPCLVVFGTAIPNHYYEALSERMLTNGFFARMIVLECGSRSTGREPRLLPLPERVLETAQWWADFRAGTGNLENWHPVPQIVPHTGEATSVLGEPAHPAPDCSDACRARAWRRRQTSLGTDAAKESEDSGIFSVLD
ncbi:hypothetical protein CO151_06220, partial [bacterium CG_4_9_14_3_um_filter_65_15]